MRDGRGVAYVICSTVRDTQEPLSVCVFVWFCDKTFVIKQQVTKAAFLLDMDIFRQKQCS